MPNITSYVYILTDEALFIFVHNIDGPMVRGSSVQNALASLSSLDNVHLIATVDHINAPLSEYTLRLLPVKLHICVGLIDLLYFVRRYSFISYYLSLFLC